MNSAVPTRRLQYVDRLRGLAVLGMFVVHSPYPWLLPEENAGTFKTTISYLSGMVAPVFLFLAGIAVCIVAQNARDRGLDQGMVRKRMILRGLGIVMAGYGLQFFFWVFGGFVADPVRILKVDILHCIGGSLALFSLLAWPSKGTYNWRGLVLFLIAVLGAQLTWRMPITEWMPDSVAGYFTHIKRWARFPMFPYGGWLALGLIVGPVWIKFRKVEGGERRFWIGIVLLALTSLFFSWGIHILEKKLAQGGAVGAGREGLRTTVHYFFYKMSWLLLLFTAARLTAPALDRIPGAWLTLLGRVSLFAYCVHLSLIYYGFGIIGKKSLTRMEWASAVAALTVLMLGLSYLWFRWPPSRLKKVFSTRFFIRQ